MEVWFFTYSLMALLIILSFMQPNQQRLLISFSFSFAAIFHAFVSEYMTDTMYYFSDGVFVSVVLAGIVLFSKPNKFTDQMVMACVASILLNVYGWMIYENYWKADSYNIAFYILYMIVAFIFLQKEGAEDHDKLGSRNSWFRLPYYKHGTNCRKIYQEAQK
jgi:peptidoglycan/LPS O-acetylase OafA/YrhL